MKCFEIRNYSFKYAMGEEPALHDINLSMDKGGVYAIIGPNGGGKTTLCKALRGFIPYLEKGDISGKILFEGKDILQWDKDELTKKIGFVFQNPFLQVSGIKDTVFEEIAFGLENLGVNPDLIKEKVRETIELLEIEELQDRNPYQLSGGQAQKVALASVVAMDQEIIIFDEPTTQLDPNATEEVFDIINTLKNQGKTIILVEHKMELVAEHADYIFILNNGQIFMKGETRHVLSDNSVADIISVPKYTQLEIEMRKKNMHLDYTPITKSETVTLLKKWLSK